MFFPSISSSEIFDCLATLELCVKNIQSIVQNYNEVFHHHPSGPIENIVELSELNDIKYYIENERRLFHQIISVQQTLVDYASVEPSWCWLKNAFSNSRYTILVQQQIEIYRMLHNINTSVRFEQTKKSFP